MITNSFIETPGLSIFSERPKPKGKKVQKKFHSLFARQTDRQTFRQTDKNFRDTLLQKCKNNRHTTQPDI